VSAIKVDGQRAYKRVRAGDEVTLAARPVTVSSFAVHEIRRTPDIIDVDVSVVCSSGTYVRALARDLGAGLGVGGHLTALRRTRVGPYGLDVARTLEQLEVEVAVLPMVEAVRAAFPVREVDTAEAVVVSHGGPLPAAGLGPGPVAVIGPDGVFLALVEERDGRAKPTAVFV
jgi:tRNA pseudouridine55 synthase